jgi:Flp pilus assembly protein TadG
MRSLKRPRRRDEAGQAIVELALVLILLLLLLVGAADVGRAFHAYIIITNAAREGARYASHFPHLPAQIRQATKDEAAQSGIPLLDSNILINPEAPLGATPGDVGVAQPGQPIQVSIEYGVPTIMSGMLGTANLTIRTRTEMVVFGLDVY